jgi:hypothetical protein
LTLRRPIREALRALAIATTIVLLVMFPWYARIIWITGNPVFPFLAKLFGDNPWVLKQPQLPANLAQLGAMPAWAESMVRGLAAPVIVAWNLIINRESLGDLPPVSPVYLVSLPALVLVPFWRQQTIPLAVAVVLLLSMLQLGLPPSAHYLVAIFPIWSLIVGYGCAIAIEAIIGRRRPQMRTPAIVSLCLLFFVPGRIYADYRRAKLGPVPTNEAEREGYLSEHLPVYPALQYLNRSRADNYTAYALFAENMIYYARGRFIGDWNGPASYPRVLKVLDNSCSLHQRLQQLGADYLIIPRANFPSVVPQDECFERCFAPVFSDLGALVFALVPRCDR